MNGTTTHRDGRRLGWTETGPASGVCVVYFHGALGSRLERPLTTEECDALGVRLITIDRPGHGLSDRDRNGTPLTFAQDLAAILDDSEIERTLLLSHSGGGMYALACCAALPGRVAGAAIVSGIAPTHDSARTKAMARRVWRTHHLARKRPWLLRMEMHGHVLVFRHAPGYGFRAVGEPAVTADPAFRERFRRALFEGARSGVNGFVDDVRRMSTNWGFDLGAIGCPVLWWHGDRDRVSPVERAREVAALVPGARFIVVPGAGHLLAHQQSTRFVRQLLDVTESARSTTR